MYIEIVYISLQKDGYEKHVSVNSKLGPNLKQAYQLCLGQCLEQVVDSFCVQFPLLQVIPPYLTAFAIQKLQVPEFEYRSVG